MQNLTVPCARVQQDKICKINKSILLRNGAPRLPSPPQMKGQRQNHGSFRNQGKNVPDSDQRSSAN